MGGPDLEVPAMISSTTTPGRADSGSSQPRPERSPAEIEAEIERTRARLAGTVDAIVDRVTPRNVARRTMALAKAQVRDEDGGLRNDRVAVIAIALVVGLVLVRWRRGR